MHNTNHHIHYVGKAKRDFNLRLSNHCKDVYKADNIPVSRHFAKDHIFNGDPSFIIIEQICKSTSSRETKKELLKQKRNFGSSN